MADIHERVEAEFENIQQVLCELPAASDCGALSALERAGVGALLHGFYNGVENVLKQVLVEQGADLPTGPSWHRDLVNAAHESGIISETLAKDLGRYLAFRHFFGHGYAVELRMDRLEPLVEDAKNIFEQVKREVADGLR